MGVFATTVTNIVGNSSKDLRSFAIRHRLPATNIPHADREAQESILADADTLVSIESSCRP